MRGDRQFMSVFEGAVAQVCANFSGVLLDRDVSLSFSIQPISATGRWKIDSLGC